MDGLGRVAESIADFTTGNAGQTGSASAPDQDLATSTVYDAAGRTLATTDPDGIVTAYTYDLLDHQTSVTKNAVTGSCTPATLQRDHQLPVRPGGQQGRDHRRRRPHTELRYDAANEQITATDALGNVTTSDYDLGGRLVEQHDPRGSADDVTYAYDGLDRQTGESAPDLTAPISATYDALGQRTSLSDGTGTTSFTYDQLGRITQVSAPTTGTVGYAYDAEWAAHRADLPGRHEPGLPLRNRRAAAERAAGQQHPGELPVRHRRPAADDRPS